MFSSRHIYLGEIIAEHLEHYCKVGDLLHLNRRQYFYLYDFMIL